MADSLRRREVGAWRVDLVQSRFENDEGPDFHNEKACVQDESSDKGICRVALGGLVRVNGRHCPQDVGVKVLGEGEA